MNPELPPDARERLQAQFGLNQPLWQQFLVYVKNVFTGSFGVSFSHYPRSVADVIAERLPRTVALFFTATVFSFYLGFLLGKIIAWKRGGWTEYATTIGGVTLYTVFTPWFALMMIWLFAFKAGWFPIGKFLDPILWREAPIDANTLFRSHDAHGVGAFYNRVCCLRRHDAATSGGSAADPTRQLGGSRRRDDRRLAGDRIR